MEAINIFLKKEIEDKMFDREIFGINYWEYVRPVISCETNSIISGGSAMFAKNPFCFKKYFLNLKNIRKYFLKKQKCDILIVSQPRRVLCNGKYKNNYIDYYIDYLQRDYKILALEEPSWSSLGVSNTAHDFPIYTSNIYLTDIHEIFFLVRKRLYKIINFKKYKKIIKEYNEVKYILNSWYTEEHDVVDFKAFFVDSIIRLEIDRKYIRKILKKTSPQMVMLHYMPSIFKEMLINECNNQKIITVEIQHGTITKVDPLVNKCSNVSLLKNDTKYIFGFGKNQINNYLLSIKDIKNVINVGFPFFEEKLKVVNKQKKKKQKIILIISQSTIGDEMALFTSELADLLKNKKYKIIFKYHPNEMSKNYECLKKKNIVEIKREKTIYDIQQQAILQIGSYSTSLYEGFAMKVPTLVVSSMFGSIETVDIFNNIKKGVYFIKNSNDVLNYLDRDDIIPLDKDINKLWQKNSEERIINSVKKIMRRHK